MAITKQKKSEIYKSLTEKIKASESMVFLNFKGLKVSETDALRRTLREKGMGYVVAKKTLLRRALTDAGIAGEMPEMEGELAVAYGTDAVTPAKEVGTFAKAHKDKVTFMGGLLESKFLSKDEMIALSKIPSREVLLGKLVNVMYAPVIGTVRVLDAIKVKKESAA